MSQNGLTLMHETYLRDSDLALIFQLANVDDKDEDVKPGTPARSAPCRSPTPPGHASPAVAPAHLGRSVHRMCRADPCAGPCADPCAGPCPDLCVCVPSSFPGKATRSTWTTRWCGTSSSPASSWSLCGASTTAASAHRRCPALAYSPPTTTAFCARSVRPASRRPSLPLPLLPSQHRCQT